MPLGLAKMPYKLNKTFSLLLYTKDFFNDLCRVSHRIDSVYEIDIVLSLRDDQKSYFAQNKTSTTHSLFPLPTTNLKKMEAYNFIIQQIILNLP